MILLAAVRVVEREDRVTVIHAERDRIQETELCKDLSLNRDNVLEREILKLGVPINPGLFHVCREKPTASLDKFLTNVFLCPVDRLGGLSVYLSCHNSNYLLYFV